MANEASNVPQLYAEIESLRNQLRKTRAEKKKVEDAIAAQHDELTRLHDTNKKLKEYIKKKGIKKSKENPEDLRRILNDKVAEMDVRISFFLNLAVSSQ